MNFVYLFGNGFDISLGLKTRYQDFYNNAYQIREDDDDLIKDFKKEIRENIDDWADLEIKLGEYTQHLKSKKEFDLIFNDIRETLNQYISEMNSFPLENQNQKKLLKDIEKPYLFLQNVDKGLLEKYVNGNSLRMKIDIITFNYTNSLEKLLESDNKINSIYHIHGDTKSRFILGVDNTSQILNPSFRSDFDIIDSLVKPTANKNTQALVDENCLTTINGAQLICIFGSSLGKTDKTWWKNVGTRMYDSDAKLIIFWYSKEKISAKYTDFSSRARRSIKNKFLAFLPDHIKNNIKSRIYVVLNSDMCNDVGVVKNDVSQEEGTM